MKKEAEEWLRIAGEELRSAEFLQERFLYRMVCYHAEQAVEKTLKAFLVDNEIDAPRTHNILDLDKALRQLGYETPLTGEDAIFLNSVYRARYPSDLGLLPSGDPAPEDALKALKIAGSVAEWSRKPERKT